MQNRPYELSEQVELQLSLFKAVDSINDQEKLSKFIEDQIEFLNGLNEMAASSNSPHKKAAAECIPSYNVAIKYAELTLGQLKLVGEANAKLEAAKAATAHYRDPIAPGGSVNSEVVSVAGFFGRSQSVLATQPPRSKSMVTQQTTAQKK